MGLKKKAIRIILILIALSQLFLNFYVQTTFAKAFAGDCAVLNTPQEIDNIVTMIEEPLSATTGTGYTTCMRRTCCETTEGNCKSSLGENFTPPPKTSSKPTTSTQAEYANFKKCYSDYTGIGECKPNADAGTTVSCKRIGIFYANSGSELLYAYIGAIYRYVASTMGIVCVLIIVWNGFNVATAGDQTAKLEEGKKKIMQSLYGLALLFMSAVILYSINPNFFVV